MTIFSIFRLDQKLNVFVEQLPSLISNKNILWDVGIYSGIKIDEIETAKENNPYNINQAGREVMAILIVSVQLVPIQ